MSLTILNRAGIGSCAEYGGFPVMSSWTVQPTDLREGREHR